MPKKATKKSSGKWEVFTVYYQEPVFGQEGVYHKDLKVMLVSTNKGRDDAIEACEKYHRQSRVICALDKLEDISNGDNNAIVNRVLEKKGIKL